MDRPFRSMQAHALYPPPCPDIHTFREAAESFVAHGGSPLYLAKVIARLGDMPVTLICPFDIYEMAKAMYPARRNTTLNRQALSPARAVMIHAYERGWCNRIFLKRFKEAKAKRKKPASHAWLHAFVRQCKREGHIRLAALVLFMSSTGARVTEAISLRWKDVDLARRFVILRKTKTSTDSQRGLTDEVAARLAEFRGDAAPDDRVFVYHSRQSVNARIAAVCRRAEISYKSSHACGRHTFATTAINEGIDIRTTMDAGGWRSSAVFIETYVHSRDNATRIVADHLGHYQFDAEL
jgi:integrase